MSVPDKRDYQPDVHYIELELEPRRYQGYMVYCSRAHVETIDIYLEL